MTQDFNIASVAVIGGGPAGLESIFELLHTSKDGKSTVKADTLPENPAFSKVVAFEQQDNIGGVWNIKLDQPDHPLPPAQFLQNANYNDADAIHPVKQNIVAPESLAESSVDNPVITEPHGDELQWSKSAIYDGLFSNVPKRFLRFSKIPFEEEEKIVKRAEKIVKESNKDNDDINIAGLIKPFINYKQVQQNITNFAKKYDLTKHVRVNTEVESVVKDQLANKWTLTLRHFNPSTKKDEWYQEQFDAVIVASGHYSVPFIPKIPGLAEYALKFPNSIIHNKSWRSPEPYANQNVLFVGGSLSSIDILQYVYPIANKTYVSRRKREQIFQWLQNAAESDGIVNKPGIARFLPETKEIEFTDGSKINDVDKIILATGYHWHYPFIQPKDKYISLSKPDPSQNGTASSFSRVKGLFQHTFTIEDPTLAFVGVKLTTLKWPTIEASAAAVAGIWSNAKQLPPKEEQIKWEQKLVERNGDNSAFHYTPWDKVKQEFVDEVIEFAPEGRENPLSESIEYIDEVKDSAAVLEGMFFKLKNKELTYEQTLI